MVEIFRSIQSMLILVVIIIVIILLVYYYISLILSSEFNVDSNVSRLDLDIFRSAKLDQVNLNGAKVCLGTRGNPDWVRCIKRRNGDIIYPPYAPGPDWWEEGERVVITPHTGVILINEQNGEITRRRKKDQPRVYINRNLTENTAGQCWPTSDHYSKVSTDEFMYLLHRIERQQS